MEQADLPERMPTTWAEDATDPTFVRTVPEASQVPTNPGFASFETGFPPLNFQPIASGGIPPFGQDVNGILRAITQWLRWGQAGGVVPYNAAFSASIGGYPAGAVIPSANPLTPYLRWLSTADDNTTDPDADGANWIPIWDRPQTRVITATGAFTTLYTDQTIGLKRAGATSTALPTTNLFTGYRVRYTDLSGNLNLQPHTVTAPGGHTIGGLSTVVMNVNRQSAEFQYFGSVSGTPTWGWDT
jgi:hypothetical protein